VNRPISPKELARCEHVCSAIAHRQRSMGGAYGRPRKDEEQHGLEN
jgi:hypothetical protein